MNNCAVISGFSSYLPYAENSRQLIENLRLEKRVESMSWFSSDKEARKYGFNSNKDVATLKHVTDSDVNLLYRLIGDALNQALLKETSLAGANVRVYLTGIGPRTDTLSHKSFYNKNDVEDIRLSTSLRQLHVDNMSQDKLSGQLARKYRLQFLPPNMNCTSNSSLTAVHLGSLAIQHDGVDLVMVVNCSKVKTQDIWFLSTQSMLDTDVVQPFGENSTGVMFADGFSVLLIESQRHRQARGLQGGIGLQTCYQQIGFGRSNDGSWLSSNILKVMQSVMKKAELDPQQLCALIPHGNGSSVTDKAEARAIAFLLNGMTVPVLAYKGQIGYTTTGSGIVDLIIGHHCLSNSEIISPVAYDTIIDIAAPHLCVNRGIFGHDKHHLLKTGIGVDGSVIGVVMSDLNHAG